MDEHFRKGAEVEVCSDDDGFKGAWYSATILKSPSSSKTKGKGKGKGNAFVQYQDLVSDEDENIPLKEYVDPDHIRPLPPLLLTSGDDQRGGGGGGYEVYDVVDGYYKDGWWKGVVAEVKDAEENGGVSQKRYTVVFDSPPDKITFAFSELRPHYDWIDGEWVRPPRKMRMEGLCFSVGMTVEVNLDKENSEGAWFEATILEEVGFNSFLVQCQSSGNNDETLVMKETVDSFNIRLPPPQSGPSNFELLQKVQVLHRSAWRDGYITKILANSRYEVFLKLEKEYKECGQSTIRLHMNYANSTWHCSSKVGEEGLQQVENAKTFPFRKGESIRNSRKNLLESPSRLTQSPRKKVNRTTHERETTVSCSSKKYKGENSIFVLPPLTCVSKSIQSKGPDKDAQFIAGTNNKCQNLHVVLNRFPVASKGVKGAENDDMVPLKSFLRHQMVIPLGKKRRTPTPQSGIQKIAADDGDNMRGDLVEVEVKHSVEGPSSHHLLHKEINLLREGNRSSEEEEGLEKNLLECGVYGMDLELLADGTADCAAKEVDVAAGGTPSDVPVDEEKLLILSLADCTVKEVDMAASGTSSNIPVVGHSPSEAFDEGSDATGIQHQTAAVSPAVNIRLDSEGVENQKLPFVKSSSTWKMVESMEVFQMLPQNPHFHPLIEEEEELREGHAIGHMCMFATLVEKITKLQVDDPRSKFSTYLKVLTDLEMMGFNVKLVVDHVNKLLSIKGRRGQLKDQLDCGQSQMVQRTNERANLRVGTGAIIQQKTKCEEDLLVLREKISALEKKIVSNMSIEKQMDLEIHALQSDNSAIADDIMNTEREFEMLAAAAAAASWKTLDC